MSRSERIAGWRKASGCVTNACVWVNITPDAVLMRGPEGPTLTFTHDEWAAFTAGVRAGEFDL